LTWIDKDLANAMPSLKKLAKMRLVKEILWY